MPTFKPKSPPSAARQHLARLLESKVEANAEAREAQSRISRLSALSQAAAPVRAKLAALDASEANAFAAWSCDPSSPPPPIDTVARTDLQRDLALAQSSSDAATRAIDSVRSEVESANRRVSEIEREIEVAATLVALEELRPIAEEASAVMARLAEARMRGQALVRVLGDATGSDRPEFNAAYAAASESLRVAFDLPRIAETQEYEFLAKIGRLRAELHVDANARIED